MISICENPSIYNIATVGGFFHFFYFHPYLAKMFSLTDSFQMGWFNHQLDNFHVYLEPRRDAFHTWLPSCHEASPDDVLKKKTLEAPNRLAKTMAIPRMIQDGRQGGPRA